MQRPPKWQKQACVGMSVTVIGPGLRLWNSKVVQYCHSVKGAIFDDIYLKVVLQATGVDAVVFFCVVLFLWLKLVHSPIQTRQYSYLCWIM